MRKRFFNSKRILTLVLALSLVVGEAGVVVAAPAATGEQTEASVSANEVVEDTTEVVESTEATESVEVQDSDVSAETAYDGTASKVIGLKGSVAQSSYTDANGVPVYYVNSYVAPASVTVLGKAETYKANTDEDSNYNVYAYNGQYYQYAGENRSDGTVTFSNPVQLLTAEPVADATTGLYSVGDGYYSGYATVTVGGLKNYYLTGSVMDVIGVYDDYEKAEAAIDALGVKNEYGYNQLYAVNGKYYDDMERWGRYVGDTYKCVVLAYRSEEITLDAQKVNLTWNALDSVDKFLSPDGKQIRYGYQVEENGVPVSHGLVSADGQYNFSDSRSYRGKAVLAPGATATYRVRGLYFTCDEAEAKDEDGDTYTTYTYNVYSVGEWSDTFTYTAPTFQKVAAPANVAVSAKKTGKYENNDVTYYTAEMDASWDEVVEAGRYDYEYILSATPLTLTEEAWSDEGAEKLGAEYEYDYTHRNKNDKDYCLGVNAEFDINYIYFRVKANTFLTGYRDSDYSAVVEAAVAPEDVKVANVPQVQNFNVEYDNNSNSFKLTWTPVEADVIIYAVEKAKGFPNYYVYKPSSYYWDDEDNYVPIVSAKGKTVNEDGTVSEYFNQDLYDNLDYATKTTIEKLVEVKLADGKSGCINSRDFDLKPGVEYSFIAYTYDNDFFETEKAPITVDGINYTKYTDLSPASAVVNAKITLAKPSVSIASAADSLKLTMSSDDNPTGFEIYKKTGKKYKKLTVTTDNVYTDVDVKKNSKYNYKVRAYYYNKDSKVKCYSDWYFVTGETSDVVNMKLDVTKKNKTSVTLKWTKVKGATKYEIYRSNVSSYDELVLSKKNSVGSKFKTTASAEKYELVKTLKGSKTKYVDKKLTTGDHYHYIVKAYYKNGKSTMCVEASGAVSLMLETPWLRAALKGTSAKLSWDKDKFASKYEIRYQIYDAERELISTTTSVDEYTYASTKKTSYTIKGIPVGGYAYAEIRAYGNKKYTDWSEAKVISNLDVAKNIKASNVVVKNADGVEVDAVKITWKAVKGAKYYEVYRSTKQGTYDADTKRYAVVGKTYIAKESNDNETDDEVHYNDYLEMDGTIVGTTAYDYAQLDTGVTYYYYVVAHGEKDSRLYSNLSDQSSSYASSKPASVTYKATVDPTLKSKKGKALITWDKVAGAKKYNVYRSTKKNTGYKLVGSTKKATYTDKKVSKGKTYYYKIEATGTNDLKANFTSMSSAKKIKVKK